MNKRSSGILIHITSLPSIHGIGDFGPTAYEFIDLLTQSGQKYWQVLPLNPTEATYGHSPYSCPSTFAGNPLLISPELLKKDGYLSDSDLSDPPDFSQDSVDFEAAALYKMEILKKAFESNIRGIAQYSDFKKFCKQNNHWLEDYCLYCSIKNDSSYLTWRDFPIELRDRHTICLAKWSEQEKHFILFYKFLQYIFFKQWFSLKKYANDKGIRIIGDIPYYINYDSSDVWANQQLFKLDNDKRPEFVAGVPPDYFSETGQLWGNPVYNWDKHKESQYLWWINRIGHNLSLFDKLRLDHFRGFVSYWEVDAGETTALNGKWVNLDVTNFLDTLFSKFDKSNFIAEDLGLITDDVKDVIKKYDLPGMKILLFAFGDDYPYGDYLPSNLENNCVIYTGTHDNNTTLGWWCDEASDIEKNRVKEYLEKDVDKRTVNWELIELAVSSRADTSIIPMQDLLELGSSSRMNTPSTTSGNWMWRLNSMENFQKIIEKLSGLSDYSSRG